MRKSIIAGAVMLCLGCQANTRSPAEHPDASTTVVEIRAMKYNRAANEDRPPETYANTHEADIAALERFLRDRRGDWRRMDEPRAEMPMATCALIYGDGRQLSFGMDDHVLIRGMEVLPLSDEEFAMVKRVCFRR